MPWSASEMASKGAKRPELAARIANAVLEKCQSTVNNKNKGRCEEMAIRIALARSNRGG